MSTILDQIGNTPLVEVQNLDTGLCRLFLKLESQNPTGSIKDRIGLSMIEAAERDGKIKPGGTLIEATAGNTGLGLALVAAQKGYRLILVIPDKMAQEKILHGEPTRARSWKRRIQPTGAYGVPRQSSTLLCPRDSTKLFWGGYYATANVVSDFQIYRSALYYYSCGSNIARSANSGFHRRHRDDGDP